MSLRITELSVARYRGLHDFALHDLGRVNFLVGQNNSGKTSVLEALALIANPLDALNWTAVAARREPLAGRARTTVERLRWLFPQQASNGPSASYHGGIEISLRGGGPFHQLQAEYQDLRSTLDGPESLVTPELATERRGARIDIQAVGAGSPATHAHDSFTVWEGERFERQPRPYPSIPIQIITPYDHLFRTLAAEKYSEARKAGLTGGLAELLALVDPRIEGLEVLSVSSGAGATSEAALYLRDHKAGLLPVEAFGDGMRRIIVTAMAITLARGGILLVDEIETAIHVSALGHVFRWIVTACAANDVQLFATTHSLEAIDAVLAADPTPNTADIVGYRLESAGETITARRYGEDLLRRLRVDRGVEVR